MQQNDCLFLVILFLRLLAGIIEIFIYLIHLFNLYVLYANEYNHLVVEHITHCR